MGHLHAMRAAFSYRRCGRRPVQPRGPAAVDAGWLVGELRKGGYLIYFRHTST